MNEQSLKDLSLDQLYDLMVKTIDQYLAIHKNPQFGKDNLEEKRSELYFIQSEILKRKEESPPVR